MYELPPLPTVTCSTGVLLLLQPSSSTVTMSLSPPPLLRPPLPSRPPPSYLPHRHAAVAAEQQHRHDVAASIGVQAVDRHLMRGGFRI